ncbi:MAG: hypothetical protein QM682_04820 [Paracoccus sp. (in: a-proteobacteria)]|uniref:hypothetical protein n=1 Tax=Paracoccus sp. TaxID=267 RepID=UPI0039E467DC
MVEKSCVVMPKILKLSLTPLRPSPGGVKVMGRDHANCEGELAPSDADRKDSADCRVGMGICKAKKTGRKVDDRRRAILPVKGSLSGRT